MLNLFIVVVCCCCCCCCCCYQVDGDASKDVPRRKDEHGTRCREPLNVILVEPSWDDAERLKERKKQGFQTDNYKNNNENLHFLANIWRRTSEKRKRNRSFKLIIIWTTMKIYIFGKYLTQNVCKTGVLDSRKSIKRIIEHF